MFHDVSLSSTCRRLKRSRRVVRRATTMPPVGPGLKARFRWRYIAVGNGGVIPASHLFVRQAEGEAVERRWDPDLTAQSAVRAAHGSGHVQQQPLIVPNGTDFRNPGLLDIDVAGCANSVAAAFRNDTFDAMTDGRTHDRVAVIYADAFGVILAIDESYLRHRVLLIRELE